jgi:hypothetical protein
MRVWDGSGEAGMGANAARISCSLSGAVIGEPPVYRNEGCEREVGPEAPSLKA